MCSLKQLLCTVAMLAIVLTLELVSVFMVEVDFDSCIKVFVYQLSLFFCAKTVYRYFCVHVKHVKLFFVLRCFLQGHCLDLPTEGSHARHVTKNDACEMEAAVRVS